MFRMYTSKEGLEIIEKEFEKLFNKHMDEITNMPPEMEVESKSLKEHVFESLGWASVCWNPRPSGQFDSAEAVKCGEQLMRHINTDVPHACGIVFKALREDPEYYYAWQANIAMAFKDCIYWEGGYTEDGDGGNRVYTLTPNQLHEIANNAAKNFLNLLIKPIDNE